MSKKRDANAPAWEFLTPRYLTKEGKQVIAADPNLDPSTMEALSVSEEGLNQQPKWYFDDITDGSDVGFATLALCIDDKPDSSMAELVAVYAKLRHLSFYETACKLVELRDKGELYRYSHAARAYVPWEPRIADVSKANVERPPAKRLSP